MKVFDENKEWNKIFSPKGKKYQLHIKSHTEESDYESEIIIAESPEDAAQSFLEKYPYWNEDWEIKTLTPHIYEL